MFVFSRPYLLMALEMMEGGELFDRISKEKRFTERKAAKYFKKVTCQKKIFKKENL